MQKAQKQPLPDLASNYDISVEQVQYFEKTGHICLREAASLDEVTAYREVIGQIVQQSAIKADPISTRNTYGKAFIQVTNLWERSEEIKKFSFARRFAKIAAELMGVNGVRMYHDQALYKEPGGGHTPWHQDQVLWPIDEKTITMWMPLVDISEEIGSMTFASGSHKLGYAADLSINDESHSTLRELIKAKAIETVTYGAMAAGDVTFHNGWTMHSAPGNPTDRTREVMTIIYVADGAKVAHTLTTRSRQNDLAAWIPGAEPGDLIESRLNPILYKKI